MNGEIVWDRKGYPTYNAAKQDADKQLAWWKQRR
jgi:hypothetical protein